MKKSRESFQKWCIKPFQVWLRDKQLEMMSNIMVEALEYCDLADNNSGFYPFDAEERKKHISELKAEELWYSHCAYVLDKYLSETEKQ